jgi:hypothetical protein
MLVEETLFAPIDPASLEMNLYFATTELPQPVFVALSFTWMPGLTSIRNLRLSFWLRSI